MVSWPCSFQFPCQGHGGPEIAFGHDMGWPKDIRQRCTINSVRTRYACGILGLLLLLASASYLAVQQVEQAGRRGDASTAYREEAESMLSNLSDHVWAVQTSLQGFMWLPNASQRRNVEASFAHALIQVDALSTRPWMQRSAPAQRLLVSLRTNLTKLERHARDVMATRADPSQLYRAIPVIQETLFPTFTDLITAATLALDEAEDVWNEPGAREAYRLFVRARHDLTMTANTFRAYMAYRSELMPGKPLAGMERQALALADYAQSLRATFKALRDLDRQGLLGIQGQQSLADMQRLFKKWYDGYLQVATFYTAPDWRRDIPMMKETVQPAFGSLAMDIAGLREEVGRAVTTDVSSLTYTAERLSNIVLALVVVMGVLAVGSFFLFERWIRRPMAEVAKALRIEAQGGEQATLVAHMAETQDLVLAFEGMRKQVRARQQRLETILENAAEGIITFDMDGVIESANQAAQKLFGYSVPELQGRDIGLLIPPSEERDARPGYVEHFMRNEIVRLLGHEGEVLGKHKDGTRFPMALKVSEIHLDGRPLYTGLVADISERKALIQHLQSMAEHDGLTGLYNRTYFQQELERLVGRVRRSKTTCALLYIDLDNFKYVNDTLGHAAGDKLLTEVAAVLKKRARNSDLIARLGGDEFTVILYEVNAEQAETVAEAFRAALVNYGFAYKAERVDIGCSIGVAYLDAQVETAAQALSRADVACHIAKRSGRNCVHTFKASDNEKVTEMSLDMGWSRRIKDAIAHNHFRLACQPIVNVATKTVEQYEVLIRLQDRDGLVLPGGFLPAAERFGLAVEIDKWVIFHAIDTLSMQRNALPELRYSINLSAKSLSNQSVYDLIAERLAATKLDPAALTFEVTETAAIADMAMAQAFLAELQRLGCKTALDDFGVGLSSFAYLQDLPVDIVKIDGRFVKNVATNPVDQAMVRAMNDIAHALGKQTVAEFVESDAAFHWLARCGVDYAQGYHFGRPDIMVPCDAIAEYAGVAAHCYL